jgi:hypothetical protein
MTSEKLAEFRAKGMLLDPKFDRLAVIGDKKKEDEEKLTEMENIEIIETFGDSKRNGKANGYYFNIDGTFYGKEGNSDKIKICIEKKTYTYFDKMKKKVSGYIYMSPKETDFNLSDIEIIAGIIYAESSIQFINKISSEDMLKEAYALGTTMINFKFKRKHDDPKEYNPTYSQLSKDMRAYGYNSKGYKKFIETKPEERNKNHMRVCTGAAINALFYNQQIENSKNPFLKELENPLDFLNPYKKKQIFIDYSNNAILWDGLDLSTNYNNHPKIVDGYLVSDKNHNVLNIKSKKVNDNKNNEEDKKVCNKLYSIKDPKFVEEKCYSYKYKTTVGFAKTMFVKLTDEFEEANINSKREKLENKFILNKWW